MALSMNFQSDVYRSVVRVNAIGRVSPHLPLNYVPMYVYIPSNTGILSDFSIYIYTTGLYLNSIPA